MTDVRSLVSRLAGDPRVLLVGVRHHSPVLAAAVPAMLDAFSPAAVLVELPAEMQEWVRWLGDPGTVAPVALAAGGAFYPFADFSPELAAVRWAVAQDVPVICCDLPLADPAWADPQILEDRAGAGSRVLEDRAGTDPQILEHRAGAGSRILEDRAEAGLRILEDRVGSLSGAVRSSLSGRDGDDLWDRWVEAGAPGSSPESVRRAALAAGWALRHDAAERGIDPLDLRREACMRGHIQRLAGRVAVIAGAFHTPALLDGPALDSATSADGPVVSLVPYTFDLLDARSGYPAGIRDPRWQQAVYDCGADPARIRLATHEFAVEVARELRSQGQPAGPGEAGEVARLAGDLANLRSLPAPGRGELVEALQTVLAQGAPAGTGRGVARAMEAVLIGHRRGRLPSGAPVTGLLPAVQDDLSRLKLPGPGAAAQRMRLDPLRSPTDRARELVIRRLAACGAPYGSSNSGSFPGGALPGGSGGGGLLPGGLLPGGSGGGVSVGGVEALTSTWRLEWNPSTDAALNLAGLHGVTLVQAAAGMLTARRRRELKAGGPTPDQALAGLAEAAACDLPAVVRERLTDVHRSVGHGGGIEQIVAALNLLRGLERGLESPVSPGTARRQAASRDGHPLGDLGAEPGPDEELRAGEIAVVREDLHAAAVAAVAGLAGSQRVEDARALHDLVRAADEAGRLLRLGRAIRGLAEDGSPLMSGAASGVGVLLGHEEPAAFGQRLASWVMLPADLATGRLRGALSVAGALLQAGGETLEPLLDVVETLPDDEFVQRLPALRGGFDAVSPADRERFLRTVEDRHGRVEGDLPADASTLADWLTADRAGMAAVHALGLDADPPSPPADASVRAGSRPRGEEMAIAPAQRWRLLLGRETDGLPAGQRRLATALDELYGTGQGEGAYTVDGGGGGGRDAAYPEVRDWLADLEDLFGARVRDEVLARAAERGRVDAVLAVDPDRVRPSVDLLHTVLSLAGGLPEARLARLRPMVARLTAELTAQLARRIRPALTGIGTPRPTQRRTGRLDLAATVRRNLHTARIDGERRVTIVPERPVFRSRGRRSVDWQVILLVDVSGSMEASTIWAAMTASILAGVPALRTHFVTFSTEVVDMTDRVSDPLSLLLEVRVGGGTHIAAGLRYARQITRVPSRTMVITISDFEEGYPIGDLLAATRALADDGVTQLGCASLDDKGRPRYSTGVASQLAAAGMPVAALSPTELARWIGEQVR